MKKCYKTLFILVVISIITTSLWAQQLPVLSHYLTNRYLLSPAFAGTEEEQESIIFIGYRREWADIATGPKTSYINGYMPVSDKVWLGAQIISDQSDIFRNTHIQFSYIYHLQINQDQFIDFSIWGTLMQNSINLGGINVIEVNDPLILNKTQLSGTALNAGAALNFRSKNFNIGFNIPYLFLNKDSYSVSSSNNLYELNRVATAYISHSFRLNYDLDLEPILLYRYSQDFVSGLEYSALLKYRKAYWVGLTYKDIGKTSVTIGAEFASNFIINYSYEFATGAAISYPGPTHEISFGFKLGLLNQKNNWQRYLQGN